MALPLYLALTPGEMAGKQALPPFFAYMACHFSPWGTGLSNMPETLPSGTMLILDDSIPMDGHDPDRILRELSAQLEKHLCHCLLLDFQRPGLDGQRTLARLLAGALPCPVGVSELCAEGLSCPVFVSPPPPDRPLEEHLAPWQGREIWLEAALAGVTLTLTGQGCFETPLFDFPEQGLQADKLHCHYTVEAPATFRLWRTREDLDKLLAEAESRGVTKTIGLWQELGR